jgi:hypothetical protein
VRRRRRAVYNPTSHRLRELERLIAARHGKLLDTDDAGEYLVHVAQTLRKFHENKNGRVTFADVLERLKVWAGTWTPLVPDAVLREAADEATQNPKMLRADALARKLHVKFREREVLDLRTIGACDVSKAARTLAKKERKRARDRRRVAAQRRQRGVKLREQWLAERLTATKPWLAQGISRRTWERRRRDAENGRFQSATGLLESVSQVCRTIETTVRSDGLATQHQPHRLNAGTAAGVAAPTPALWPWR